MNYKKDEFEEEDQTDNFSFCSYTVLFIIKIWKTINKYRLVMKNTQIVILKKQNKDRIIQNNDIQETYKERQTSRQLNSWS